MPDRKSLLALARLGAKHRLTELKKEIHALEKLVGGTPQRAKNSAHSERMKEWWRNKKAKNKKAPPTAKR